MVDDVIQSKNIISPVLIVRLLSHYQTLLLMISQELLSPQIVSPDLLMPLKDERQGFVPSLKRNLF